MKLLAARRLLRGNVRPRFRLSHVAGQNVDLAAQVHLLRHSVSLLYDVHDVYL